MNLAIVTPGKDFTKGFLTSWTNLLTGCFLHGIVFRQFPGYSPVLHEVRNLCMGADYLGGKNQIPFNGWSYDYILFIDSDMVFTFSDLKALLSHNKDIVAGWYALQLGHTNGERLSSLLSWNNAGIFPNQLYTTEELTDLKENQEGLSLINVDGTGFGFLLVKMGVFENIEYPWFYPSPEEIETIRAKMKHEVIFTIREDIAWCEKVTSLGYDIWADLNVRVGHDKRVTL